MSKITYTDKVALNENPSVADVNKVKASDLNEIKNVVNANDDKFNYSTSEQRIGTWIDGKPLYRKVLTGTTVIGSTLVFTIPNIETFVELSGIIKVQDNYINSLPFYENAEVFGRIQGLGNNITVITSSSEYANGSTMIIAKYTKTTD